MHIRAGAGHWHRYLTPKLRPANRKRAYRPGRQRVRGGGGAAAAALACLVILVQAQEGSSGTMYTMRAVLVPRSTVVMIKSKAATAVMAVKCTGPGAQLRMQSIDPSIKRQKAFLGLHRSLADSPRPPHKLVLQSRCIHRELTKRKPQPRPAHCMSKHDGHSEPENTMADMAPADNASLVTMTPR